MSIIIEYYTNALSDRNASESDQGGIKDMLDIIQASQIARIWNKKYDTVQEYFDGYYFFIDDGQDRAGGEDSGTIIHKGDGRRISIADYFLSGKYDAVDIGNTRKLVDILPL